MRSVFRDITDNFFEILSYKKEEWNKFWHIYKIKVPYVELYQKKNELSDEKILNKLFSYGRKYLDEMFWYKFENAEKVKTEIIKMVGKNVQKYNLQRGDYTVRIIGLTGDKPYEFVDTYAGTIILIDYLYFYKNKEKTTIKEIMDKAILDFIENNEVNEKKANFWITYDEIKKVVYDNKNKNIAMKKIVKILDKRFDYFDWTGFYLVENNELKLGEFIGEPTEHKKIKFGEGICGQAAETQKTFVVKDVNKESNYLSCSPKTKSEIVVPIFGKNNSIVGEIDIDSHKVNAFDDGDKEFLENIAILLKKYF
ncbi:GAF domain containing protein [Tepiditoga spiralis]|uniref:GAF domain containing protein n=1 Tax=Tepiditoga spiralis TaxID=2108365 RepID=A0A7G1GC70_9BACT|nr:GAF domain-containing protein [Tepiditoga spiralis]BBE31849.1 GAF domain containing protein [Tepiditoga spiralis]